MKRLELVGMVFGKLTVIADSGRFSGEKRSRWLCRCECGGYTKAVSNSLTSGNTTSCGCGKKRTTHGKSNSRIYTIWQNMRARCYNLKSPNYEYYGGRGIIVCEEWNSDFVSFYNWAVGCGYSPSLTIDRKDNNGNYEPLNCRWVTMKEQSQNRRFPKVKGFKKSKFSKEEMEHIFELRNSGMLQREIAEVFAVSRSTISHILNKRIVNFN